LPNKGLIPHLMIYKPTRTRFLNEDLKLDATPLCGTRSPETLPNDIGLFEAKNPDRVGKRKGMGKTSRNSSDAQKSIDIVSDNGQKVKRVLTRLQFGKVNKCGSSGLNVEISDTAKQMSIVSLCGAPVYLPLLPCFHDSS